MTDTANYTREIAGVFAGVASLLLIWQGHYEPAIAIVGSMVGFFVGEKNGERKAAEE